MASLVVGNKDIFAIQFSIDWTDSRMFYGQFLFWVTGNHIGDANDATMVSACYNWIEAFLHEKYERRLAIEKKVDFNELHKKIRTIVYEGTGSVQESAHYYRTYVITHLGMSSFDSYDVFLIENQGEQIIIWHDANNKVTGGAVFPRETIQQVCAQFVTAYTRAMHDFMSQHATE